MIYAPPSREKSKQTMRSPMLDKNALNITNHNGTAFGAANGTVGSDEYLMGTSIYSGGGGLGML
jgi:hypothetical protein